MGLWPISLDHFCIFGLSSQMLYNIDEVLQDAFKGVTKERCK